MSYEPGLNALLTQTISDFREFENFCVCSGFEILANRLLGGLVIEDGDGIFPISENGTICGFRRGTFGIVLKRNVASLKSLASLEELSRIVSLTDKYVWKDYDVTDGALSLRRSGAKPKLLADHLSENSN